MIGSYWIPAQAGMPWAEKSPESSKTHGGFWKCFDSIKHLRNNTTPWGESMMPRCCREVVHRFLIWIFLQIANLLEKKYLEHGGHIVRPRVLPWTCGTNNSSSWRVTLVALLRWSCSLRRWGREMSFLSLGVWGVSSYLLGLCGNSSTRLRLRFCPILGVRRIRLLCELHESRLSSCSDILLQDDVSPWSLCQSYPGGRDWLGWLYETLRCSWNLWEAFS